MGPSTSQSCTGWQPAGLGAVDRNTLYPMVEKPLKLSNNLLHLADWFRIHCNFFSSPIASYVAKIWPFTIEFHKEFIHNWFFYHNYGLDQYFEVYFLYCTAFLVLFQGIPIMPMLHVILWWPFWAILGHFSIFYHHKMTCNIGNSVCA